MGVDWMMICINLRRIKPLAAIGREIGSEEKTLNRLARGEVKEPRFSLGIKLLDLHYDLCPDRHNEMIFRKCR